MTKQTVEGLNTQEVINAAAEFRGTTKVDAEKFVRESFAFYKELILTNQAGFTILGLGKLEVSAVPEREHRVPKAKGEPEEFVTKPEHYALKLKVSKGFKEELESKPVQ